MRRWTALISSLALSLCAAAQEPRASVVVVVGASGTPEFGERFAAWAQRWERAAASARAGYVRIGAGAGTVASGDRELLKATLERQTVETSEPLWLVLLGHGTYDLEHAKFNLRGADVAASELSSWLAPLRRPVAVLVCAAASGPFVNQLSAPGRVVLSATRSGHEYSFSHFGEYLSAAVVDPRADLDKDRQVSLLEAFLFASAALAEFYEGESRLATEHPLIDDNGDGLGTPADWFRGVHCIRTPAEGHLPDGLRAHQLHLVPSAREQAMPAALRAQRDALELEIEALRRRREQLGEAAYLEELEKRMLPLARLYARTERD